MPGLVLSLVSVSEDTVFIESFNDETTVPANLLLSNWQIDPLHCTVKPVLTVHCHKSQPALKD